MMSKLSEGTDVVTHGSDKWACRVPARKAATALGPAPRNRLAICESERERERERERDREQAREK